MLVHSFDRFNVVTKFMLPMIGDNKFSKLNFDHTCAYMKKEYAPNTDSRRYLTELRTYCNKIKPFVSYNSKLIDSYTLNSAYNKVAFSKKLAIMKENVCTKYTTYTYKYVTLNEKPPIKK